MIRLNYWLNGLGLGGTEKTAYLFAKYLNKNDFKITTFTYEDADLARLSQFLEVSEVKLIKRGQSLDKALSNCDILHSFRSGQREFPEPGIDCHPSKFIETNVFGSFDTNSKITKSLFMSKWLMEYCIRQNGRHDERFDYIYNPTEGPASFTERYDLGLKEGTWILGRNGRPDNGVYDNINVLAARELLNQGFSVHMLCLAAPPAMIDDMDRLGIPNTVLEPTLDPLLQSKFYNSIDIYTEGRPDGHTCSCVLQEAMIHKKPTVAHIAIPKYAGMGVFQAQADITVDKKTGFVTNYDVKEYAEAIKKIMLNNDLRESMSIAGRDRAMKEFHVHPTVDKLAKIYKEVAR